MNTELPLESRGEAPTLARMVGRRVLVVGAGQTDYDIEDQPIGNGRAISILLAREGAKVVAADYDKASADGTVELITAEGGDASTLIADVADPRDVEQMVERGRDWLGGLDGIVYNVGIAGPQDLAQVTPEAWDHTMNVNLRGAMLTARAALPVMDTGSAFVFISSIGAYSPGGRLVAYSAAKIGMESLARDVSFAGRDRAIRANIVMPGGIDTGMARNQLRKAPVKQRSGTTQVRPGTAWEVAYATLFLLSHESAYVTAHTIPVDGGRLAL